MGLMDAIRGEFIDIIEFLDDSRDTLVWRFPRHDNEIKNGAQLVVREGQQAVFVNEGQIADVFGPGTHSVETKNLPILSTLKGWKYGFDSPFKAEVYFVGTRQYTDMKWGTQNPVTLRDAEFGMVRLRAFGTYALRITDGAKLLRELVGTDPQFRTEEVSEFLRQSIVSQLGTALAQANVPMLDLAANQQGIADKLALTLSEQLGSMGIEIPRFVIENISLPKEVEEVLDKRTSMGVLGNLDQYAKFQAATAIGDAANNPGGAGEGVGLGVGVALGQQMAGALAPQAQPPAQPAQPPAAPAAAPATPAAAAPPPLPTTSSAFFVAIGGQQVGPLDRSELQERVAAGELTPETLVWRDGMDAWTPASDVAEIRALFPATPPPLPPSAPPVPPTA
ncbi:SPFH domain-containing protein [Nocardioides sp. 1609]|uniref:SPFH domain-containing protein n=1 Tax=Nocardioides sp. 1609 TaxID=2508327 RepID=UPI00106F7076|nr:SPFH domain-containing protein [Nocardioides sp. 1609]